MFNWIGNLFVAVGLAARARLRPDLFERLMEFQGSIIRKGNDRAFVAYSKDVRLNDRNIHEECHRLAEHFGLVAVGPGNKTMRYGYCRLPSDMRNKEIRGKRRLARFSRWQPRGA